MSRPVGRSREGGSGRPLWLGLVVRVALLTPLFLLAGHLFADDAWRGLSGLGTAVGAMIGATIVAHVQERRQQSWRDSTSRWAAGPPTERWH
jgi:hypothetical protein